MHTCIHSYVYRSPNWPRNWIYQQQQQTGRSLHSHQVSAGLGNDWNEPAPCAALLMCLTQSILGGSGDPSTAVHYQTWSITLFKQPPFPPWLLANNRTSHPITNMTSLMWTRVSEDRRAQSERWKWCGTRMGTSRGKCQSSQPSASCNSRRRLLTSTLMLSLHECWCLLLVLIKTRHPAWTPDFALCSYVSEGEAAPCERDIPRPPNPTHVKCPWRRYRYIKEFSLAFDFKIIV